MQSGDKALEMEQVRHIVHSNGNVTGSWMLDGWMDVFINSLLTSYRTQGAKVINLTIKADL